MINKRVFRIRKDGKPYCNCICRTPQLIENYDLAIADKTQTWECHHRNEKYYSQKDLKKLGLYYDCPPCELIFLTENEHKKLDSFCRRMSDVNKGKTYSEETLQKMSKSVSNLHWYNNGIKSIRAIECPEGFKAGRIYRRNTNE